MTDLKRTIEEGAAEFGRVGFTVEDCRAYGIACAKAALEEARAFVRAGHRGAGLDTSLTNLLASLDSAREGRGEQREQEKP